MKLATSLVLGMSLFACGSSASSSSPDARSTSPEPDGGGVHDDGGKGKDGGGAGTATLTWDAPTTYTNGTPLTVAGYHVYYGTASRAYGLPIDAKTAASYVFTAPSPATYYFAVTAYDSSGSESQPSTEVSKKIE